MEEHSYIRKKLFATAILLLVIGGLNLAAVTLFKMDFINELLGKGAFLTNLLFLSMGVAALAIGFYRDSYLPFLGPTIMPCALLNPQTPKDADFEVQVTIRPGVKVLYWAAEPANTDLHHTENWRQAYSDYKNAGVAVADGEGVVTLKVRKPQPYSVPIKGVLEPHIHYRVCEERGWVGAVKTVTLDQKEYFENIVSEQESPEPIVNPPPAPELPLPKSAMEKINSIAATTAKNSLMVETGAPDEFKSPLLTGADYDMAYST